MSKVAIVTGSNKGLGFGIVRALCKKFKGDVYLTSRDIGRGEQAVKDLEGEGLHPKFHQLDITDKTSINALKQHLEKAYGGVDILVNNAGMAYKGSSTVPFGEQAKMSMKTNYTALIDVCDAIFPILKPGARVVHVSSGSSTWLMKSSSKERYEKIKATRTVEEVSAMMAEFVAAAKDNKHKDLGWIDSAYGASKVGVTCAAPIQQAAFDKDISRQDILVNACCPGYVDTDMTSHKGPLTIDEGADTPVYLALLDPAVKSPKGDYVTKRKVYKWRNGELP